MLFGIWQDHPINPELFSGNLAIRKYDPPGIQSQRTWALRQPKSPKISQQQPWSIYSDLNGTTRSRLQKKRPIYIWERMTIPSLAILNVAWHLLMSRKKMESLFKNRKRSQQGLTFQVSASWQYKTVMVEPLAFNLGPIQVAFCEMWMTFKKWMCKQKTFNCIETPWCLHFLELARSHPKPPKKQLFEMCSLKAPQRTPPQIIWV